MSVRGKVVMTSVILLKFSKENSLPLTLFQFDILFIRIFNQRSRLRSKSYEDRFLRYDYFSPTKLIIKKKQETIITTRYIIDLEAMQI